MNSKINHQILKTVKHDSGALGPLGMVIHQFGEPGVYRAGIHHRGIVVADTEFVVDPAGPIQLSIDLSAQRLAPAAHDCKCNETSGTQQPPTVSPKGYVLFHASSGDGYSVTVAAGREKVVFDSTKLDSGDLYATSLLEPGKYAVQNTLNGSKASIEVTLTPEEARRLRAIEPLYIDVGRTFEPSKLKAIVSQGLVFRVKEPARIVIERQGDRDTSRPAQPVIRWRKPVLTR